MQNTERIIKRLEKEISRIQLHIGNGRVKTKEELENLLNKYSDYKYLLELVRREENGL